MPCSKPALPRSPVHSGSGIFDWWVSQGQVFGYLAYPDTPCRYAELAPNAHCDTPSRYNTHSMFYACIRRRGSIKTRAQKRAHLTVAHLLVLPLGSSMLMNSRGSFVNYQSVCLFFSFLVQKVSLRALRFFGPPTQPKARTRHANTRLATISKVASPAST